MPEPKDTAIMFLSRMIRVPKRLLLRGHLIGALLTFLCIICPASGIPTQRDVQQTPKANDQKGNQIKFKDTTNRKPAAHLEANPFIKNSLNWRSDLDNSFICCGLLLNNNTLHITKNGLYFVYTQATFSGNTCLEGDSIFLSHSVVLDSKQFAEKTSLLSAQKTACSEQRKQGMQREKGSLVSKPHATETSVLWSRSIFLGGTFALENGDILYTVTQGQNHLALYPGEAYFGLYAL
ncbi:hypothetical protein XENTR_v10021283 [Xenopus tropicalis]|uniref:Lymphotoxin-alpha n=1 Tax=Xenopus tropicalis TaxID=8364 RepID=A0A803KAF3_XENTR|nr:lymphotoxin-alpha isoform X1 [Xenopus tropicalis]KAE8585342.1 hypothetical protein XENTR_v10021283 [Xenopus tropicalis]